jgi:hypothetical protein
LFPRQEGTSPDWLAPLVADVQQELDRSRDDRPDMKVSLEAHIRAIEDRQRAWRQTLGDVATGQELRHAINLDYEDAARQLSALRSNLDGMKEYPPADTLITSEQVLKQLAKLDEVLKGQNVTETNLELALHIDSVNIYADGRIELVTCRLGAFGSIMELLRDPPDSTPDTARRTLPKRRIYAKDNATGAPATFHPDRFAGLDDDWFWSDWISLEPDLNWYQQHADEVWHARNRQPRPTMQNLAKEFGVSIPTLRKALREAESRLKKPDQEPPMLRAG